MQYFPHYLRLTWFYNKIMVNLSKIKKHFKRSAFNVSNDCYDIETPKGIFSIEWIENDTFALSKRIIDKDVGADFLEEIEIDNFDNLLKLILKINN